MHQSSHLPTAPTLSPIETSHTAPIQHDGPSNDASTERPLSKWNIRSGKKHKPGVDEIRGPLGLRSLFSSPETLIDLVFVHGLGGGSRKTFCKDDNPALFWPEQWLPTEPEFSNASIHSFGYDSDWGSSKASSLTVHDFGRSLYEELLTSPLLRHNSKNRPIILIGHSMGGLVIKKTYILAQQDQTQHSLSNRIRSIFFLATPHKGSDYADFLGGALGSLSFTTLTSRKNYINDLKLDSVSMQQINEEFSRLATIAELTIYTFYELNSTIPITSTLIVKKKSAVLGLSKHEHIQFLEADHRGICKFTSMDDSNYVRVKNALGTAVESSLENVFASNKKNRTEQLQNIKDLLGSPDLAEEHHDMLEGSCRWIEDREDFQQWGNPEIRPKMAKSYQAEVLWIQAQPGAGKTVLAAHVAARLTDNQVPIASYYFQYGKKTRESLSGLLISLAYQMASTNAGIREKLAQLCEEGTPLHNESAYTIWTRVFVRGVFQVPMVTPQFWIVDGLDECINSHEFSRLLNGSQIQFPLRLFVTSRKLPTMQKVIDQLTRCKATVVQIPVDDTMRDINSYISKRLEGLPVHRQEEQAELANKIRAKCNACFLWVRLVMNEMERVYCYESIAQVLEEIPEGMLPYYKRAVTEMTGKREIPIAKAILRWTVLAARPLSVPELSNAIEQDLKIKLSSQKEAIEGLCGQLVSINPETQLVQIVHATAREFLMSDEAGDFKISRSQGHEAMALACIRTLSRSAAMIPPRSRLLESKRPVLASSALLNYATTYFSDHVFTASTLTHHLLQEICNFLNRNILKWIETVVTNNELHILIRTAKNLKGYLDRRARYEPPVNLLVRTVDGWVTDLSRISSKFGRALTSSPQSIFFLIPPLCPTQSAIYKQFLDAKQPNGLIISGSQFTKWDDCIAHIHFENDTATAITSGNSLIAVGMDSGNINLYSSQSYEQEKVLHHGASVDLLKFDPLGSFLVSSSRKLVIVWELDGTVRWRYRIRSRCILLSSSQTVLIGVTQHGRSYQWDIMTGELLGQQSYVYQAPDSDGDSNSIMGKAPSTASLSPGLDLLALAYRNSPVCIFDFGSGTLVSWIIDDKSRAAEQIVFNPNQEVGLLAVAYNESHLALYDPWSGALITSMEAERPAILSSITCSPDGRTFATMDNHGHLRIWDFESLALLYHVLTPTTPFSLLEFTSDTASLVNLDEHEMRIWAPSALIRNEIEDKASVSEVSVVMTATEGQYERLQASKIKVLIAHPKDSLLCAGNQHGDVLAYPRENGYQSIVLYSHDNNAGIRYIAVSSNNLIATADANAQLQVRHLNISPLKHDVKASDAIFEVSFSTPIRQLLFDESGAYLLVSTLASDHVYRTDGSLVGVLEVKPNPRKIWKWIIAPSSVFEGQFLLVADHKFICYSIEHFPAVVYPEPFPLDFQTEKCSIETTIDSFVFQPETSTFILEVRQQRDFTPHSTTFIFELSTSTSPPTLRSLPSLPRNIVKRFIGINQTTKRLMFLDQESSWICSVDPQDLRNPLRRYTQHFLVPDEYVPTNGEVPPVQTADGDFAFCLFDKVVVVRNGLKFQTVKEIV